MKVFNPVLVFQKMPSGKSRDKFSIQCLECFGKNLYIGTKEGVVEYLTVNNTSAEESLSVREVGKRQMGRSGAIGQLTVVPVLNHLLVLWDGSVTVLNMFSLELLPALKKIQNVSLFYVSESAVQTDSVELIAASTKRKTVSVYKVHVDRWECVRQVALPQEPVVLAVHGTCLCVATCDRYFLHDYQSQTTLDLFPHNLGKQNIIANKCGKGEFILNGPGCLGMFVMKNGTSQHPPVQWPDGVVDAAVLFPYVLVLQNQTIHIYSILDQQLKQTVPLQSAKSLVSTEESVFVVADKEIHRLSPVPLEDQIEDLVKSQRVDEALMLLDRLQDLLPKDSYKDLHKNVICTSGMIKFYREAFVEAKELFIKGELDPREIISLYPAMPVMSEDFTPQTTAVSNAKDLWTLSRDDWPTFQQYLIFLDDFLREVRPTGLGQMCPQDIDSALFKLYLEQGEYGKLDQLVSTQNNCNLQMCVPDLEQHKRFFTLGLLYQSQGQHFNAIQTWVKIVEEQSEDPSHISVFQQIVNTLSNLEHKPIIWKFVDWVLQRDQEAGILIFTKTHAHSHVTFAPEEVLTILTSYPLAMTLYLDYLVNELHSKEEKHHTMLITSYVKWIRQSIEDDYNNKTSKEEMRHKLQQLLWQSSFYNVDTIYDQITPSFLHVERAILLGKSGKHKKALQVLVHEEKDQQAAESYCWRTSAGRDRKFTQGMFLSLLQIYLESCQHVITAVDLLNKNAASFDLVSVLRVLPDSWSLKLVLRFLCESLRGTVHDKRMRGLEMSLAKVETLRHKHVWMEATHEKIRVDRGCVCHSCQKRLTRPEFLHRPTGELTHISCHVGESGH
ncbi:transforming growth factor-beta receptor-associated protein 1 [Sinocyclocheilus grahami]|uniref:Transforming growth factor-beta receptor-associated protein 1-like n=1 Tax=Sinocyclocheilus grahami TaxID=75366 RepID=A0A672PYV7_SINGR|nr:PREDICTED: transforming growth factor-beta receptor-associated protein 1-like [Sinocyclocheilus grahami]